MNRISIQQLSDHLNNEVTSFFLVRSRETRTRKTGEPYIHVLLADATGEIEARIWDNLEAVPEFDRDDFIKVKASVQEYKGRLQLSVTRARKAAEEEIEVEQFFRRSARHPEEMFAELSGIVAGVEDASIRALLEAVLADEEIATRLKRAPAAKALHHAYLGGLLEHVLSLCSLAQRVAAHYGTLDLDLLIAACVLHDIGKLYELEYARSITYSTEGQLLGHIVQGLALVRRKIEAIPDFPPKLAVLIEHLLISHHGEYEYGSPRLPLFAEAVVFHYLDDLDSKVNHIAGQIESAAGDGEWTAKSFSLGRALLRRDRYAPKEATGGQVEPAAADDAVPEGAGELAQAAAAAEGPLAQGGLFGPATTADDFSDARGVEATLGSESGPAGSKGGDDAQ